MYEDVSIETLFKNMMAQIPDTMDKRPSSLAYLLTMPTAIELKQLYLALDLFMSNSFADTADRQHLIEIAREMSMAPNAATVTKVTGQFNLAVESGRRFSTGKYVFFTTEAAALNADGYYYAHMESETAGALADEDYLGASLVPITTTGAADKIEGLIIAKIAAIVERGEDEEDTETFRKRYFAAMKWDSYGGNIADYKAMLATIPGVGGAKVIPVWNGGGTVKLVITDSAHKVPSDTLVAQVQEAIDPPGMSGKGYGLAPIDHTVTVAAPEELKVNITFDITLETGQTWASVEASVKSAIEVYISDQRTGWEDSSGLVIRTAYIESAVLALQTVTDVQNTTLNGKAGNLTCTELQLPMLGTVTGTVVS